jgi:hypothetical protein
MKKIFPKLLKRSEHKIRDKDPQVKGSANKGYAIKANCILTIALPILHQRYAPFNMKFSS